LSTWAERHGVDEQDEAEVPREELFDEQRAGWARWDPDDYDFIDAEDEDEDAYPRE
jgi:hypothetical protein